VKLIFATNNRHKLDEIRSVLGSRINIISLSEAGITREIPEPFETLRENAAEKARTIHLISGGNCFSEDTGLEVDALHGRPGVHSARFAGEPPSYTRNTEKLLKELAGINNRHARFVTVICLIWEGVEYYFEGRCEGHILHQARGNDGFGYDPVFMPEGADRSFAEMTMEEKNRFSHRRKAADQLIAFLYKETGADYHGQSKN